MTTIDLERDVAAPTAGPLSACQSVIHLSGIVPTAQVNAEFDDGPSVSWRAPDVTFDGKLPRPLAEGKSRLRQLLPGCEFTSPDAVAIIAVEQKPAQPRPLWFCPESRRIAVENLEAGNTVQFSTQSIDDQGHLGPEQPLMIAGASGGRQEFDLPRVVGGEPGPIVSILVRQTGCALTSDAGSAREYPRPNEGFAPPARPSIVSPVYVCARHVRVSPSGWGTGILRSHGRQLADPFTGGDTLPVTVTLWFNLDPADELVGEYTGCNPPTARTDPPVPASAVTNPMPDVTIQTPLPGDTELLVSNALPDARIIALVDGKARCARTTLDGSAMLPLGLTPF